MNPEQMRNPADYHPINNAEVFSAVSTHCAIIKMLILHILSIIYVTIFVTEHSRLLSVHCTSQTACQSNSVGANVYFFFFASDFPLLKFESLFSAFPVFSLSSASA